ncbi:hypothetical protein [Roseospirillum parvum]|uniref:SmpA / OmlA family protein n=1 Tax=Roseospirillum parvum TaxID=83401 RepID=A0A1G8FSW6_9PROT|nr:hypothetical protein [Roseospirillum parvum]SDH85233.1 hypothetical protein SAMN05421742_11611 [Roseospirillum parvum]
MPRSWRSLALIPVLALGLAACKDTTKDILDKAEGASTKAELEAALGDPDSLERFGPAEKWTYDASNGTVTFPIAGDMVGPPIAQTAED